MSVDEVEHALEVLSKVDLTHFVDDEVRRQKTIARSRALLRRLEKPHEALVREVWTQPMASVAIKIGQDMQLYTHLENNTCNLDELAQATKASPGFLLRLLNLLTALKVIEQAGDGRYRGTAMSKSYTDPGMVGGMTHLFTQVWPCFSSLPDYLEKNGYREPEDVAHGPWQHGLNTTDAFFDWLAKRPAVDASFHDLMAVSKVSEYSWTNVYPVSVLTESPPADPEIPLLVDVGGGIGSDIQSLRKAILPLQFKLEVQDVEAVVAQGRRIPENSVIDFRVHNFFNAQPVLGARAYFLHSILHDWPDHLAVRILQNLAKAMKPDYSRLLLCESVVPEGSRSQMTSTMDILMMGLLCSKERSEAQWVQILKHAGFRIDKIWRSENRTLLPVIEASPVIEKPNM